MADRALSTSRRALLGAAAALPFLKGQSRVTVPCEWTTRLACYRGLADRAKAVAETGWFRAANDTYARACADPAADRKAAFARVSRAEHLYWRRCTAPMQEAAEALVLTPATDLEALREKLAAIRTHQVHEEGSMARDCIEVLEKDVDMQLCRGETPGSSEK
jgi:hypothetical protein